MPQPETSREVVPPMFRHPSSAMAEGRMGTGGRLTSSVPPAGSGNRSECVNDLATQLEALAQHVNGLSLSEDLDAERFIQLDMAAHNAYAAANAIDLADGTAPTVAIRSRPTELAEAGSGQISPELASQLIQRLFAAGLQLASLQSLLGEDALCSKAAAAIEELDRVIRDVRIAALT